MGVKQLTLWITTFGKIFEVNNRRRPIPKTSLNSRKCCIWQFISGYDRQSCIKSFQNVWMPVL